MATEIMLRQMLGAFLRTVPGIGTVHDRERDAEAREDGSNAEPVAALLRQPDGSILGAVVNHLRVREDDDDEIGRVEVLYTFGVLFVRTHDDSEESYERMLEVVEASATVLRMAPSLGLGIDDAEHGGLQRQSRPRVVESERFGKVIVRPCLVTVRTYAEAGVC